MDVLPHHDGLACVGTDADAYRVWKRWEHQQFGRCDEGAYYSEELARSGYRDLAGRRVLELGFGNGGFAQWSTSRGADYTGTEMDQCLVDRARVHGLRALHADRAADELKHLAPFDLIVAWDVLEHVPRNELISLLEGLRSMLSPAGAVVARIPSGDSPFACAIQNGDLSHYPALGSAAVHYVAARCGYSAVSVRGAALPILGFGALSTVRRSIVRLTDWIVHPWLRLLMRNRAAVLTPNMVITLRP